MVSIITEDIREKTRGVKIKEKVGSSETALSEFYEERMVIENKR